MHTTLDHLNVCGVDEFVFLVGPAFEHSPWVARAVQDKRPFPSAEALCKALEEIVHGVSAEQQLALLREHPCPIGHSVLTGESTREMNAAGLGELSDDDQAVFEHFHEKYKMRHGFPFIICTRQHDKNSILDIFPARLARTREEEIAESLNQICQIARLRIKELLQPKANVQLQPVP